MNDRKRFAPVSLPAEEPVTKFVVDCFFAKILFLEPGSNFFFEFCRRQPVKLAGVYGCSITGETSLYGFRRFDNLYNIKPEFVSEFKVTLVMGRHCHYSTCAIAYKYVIAYPDWYFFAVNRIYRKSTGKFATLFLC